MKRFLALLFTLLMLLPAVSCGGNTTKAPASTPSSGAPASGEATPTPTPTPTPSVDPHEKKLYNTETSTEEDLNVIPVGLYEFVFEDGRKLAYTKRQLEIVDGSTTENTQFLVSFQNAGTDSGGRKNVRYILYTGDSVERSVFAAAAGALSIQASDDPNKGFWWYIEENEDGTVILKSKSGTTTKALSINENGKLALSFKGNSLKMNLITKELKTFKQVISEKGDIIMRMSSKVKLTDKRLKKLTNDMQVAYDTFYEMTNYLAHESIVIRVYQEERYYGYILRGWNVISFNLGNAIDDLGNIRGRDNEGINDWNFCLLHEMGHMFDDYRGWNFHGEFATNMKVAYVLYANLDVGAAAATAGYGYKTCFKGNEIVNMWNTCPRMTSSTGFNLDRVLYVFVSYAEEIGWDNVKKAYHEIQAMPTQESDQVKCLDLFTNTMAKYAPGNKHVKDCFKAGEWEIIIEEIS
jgi:hypothetical protein